MCIPLWPKGQREISESLSQLVPTWNGISISDKGTYLGFVLGPGKGSSSWTRPVEKYVDRVARWRNLGCGLQFAVLSYNVFCASTLLFVGQLESIPPWVKECEETQVCKMFPGPGAWLTCNDAWHFKECYGLTRSAIALQDTVMAAQFRVATLGCHFGRNIIAPSHLVHPPADNIWSRRQELFNCLRNSDFVFRIALWRVWYDGCYCKVLTDNLNQLKDDYKITPNMIFHDISKCEPNMWDIDALSKIRIVHRCRAHVLQPSRILRSATLLRGSGPKQIDGGTSPLACLGHLVFRPV